MACVSEESPLFLSLASLVKLFAQTHRAMSVGPLWRHFLSQVGDIEARVFT